MSLKMILPTERMVDHHRRAQAFGNHQAGLKVAEAAAARLDYPAISIGMTPDGNVSVYYDPSLGQPGAALAQQVLIVADVTYLSCQKYFSIKGQPVNVIIAALGGMTDGSGGAYHNGCDFNTGGDLYCDAALGNQPLTSALMAAELTECFMGQQNRGWSCDASNGEALSRFLAEQTSDGPDGVLAAYGSAQQWDAAGRPNWIDATEPTDQNLVSIGCGLVYLYWMLSQGYTAAQITQAGCPDGTLSSNYAALTDATTAWASFQAALATLNGPIDSDNPWGNAGAPQPAPPAQPGGQIVIDTGAKMVTLPAGWNVQNDIRPARQRNVPDQDQQAARAKLGARLFLDG
jgi:hypothetical protein